MGMLCVMVYPILCSVCGVRSGAVSRGDPPVRQKSLPPNLDKPSPRLPRPMFAKTMDFAKSDLFPKKEPLCFSNRQVWLTLKDLTGCKHPKEVIRDVQFCIAPLSQTFLRIITKTASEARNMMPCKLDLTRFAIGNRGSFCFPVVFEDRGHWLLRLRFAYLDKDRGVFARDITILEQLNRTAVFSMEFLANQTNIPVPRVHSWGTITVREQRCVFIVMDFVDGISMSREALDALDQESRKEIYEQLARVAYEMSKVRLPQIGSIKSDEYPEILGKKYMAIRSEIGPFTDTKLYYKMLAVRYWEYAMSRMSPQPRALTDWTWTAAHGAERDLFSAYLYLQLAEHIQQQEIPPTAGFLLQNPRLFENLSNYLFNKDGELVAVVEWEECATVPLWGFHPVPFAQPGEENQVLEMLSEIQKKEGFRGETCATIYAMPLSLCMRKMEMLMVVDCDRWKLALDIYQWIFKEELTEVPEHPENVKAVMQRALDQMKVWVAKS